MRRGGGKRKRKRKRKRPDTEIAGKTSGKNPSSIFIFVSDNFIRDSGAVLLGR